MHGPWEIHVFSIFQYHIFLRAVTDFLTGSHSTDNISKYIIFTSKKDESQCKKKTCNHSFYSFWCDHYVTYSNVYIITSTHILISHAILSLKIYPSINLNEKKRKYKWEKMQNYNLTIMMLILKLNPLNSILHQEL